MTQSPALVWFREDLRLSDNPALTAALDHGPSLCLYIFDTSPERRALGGAARWWLSRSLMALSTAIAARGGELLVMRGDPAEILPQLVRDAGIGFVAWNRRYEASAIALDKALKTELVASGLVVESFNAALLNEPWQVKSKAGGPMQVFTPYWRAARERGTPGPPLPAPEGIRQAKLPATLRSMTLSVDELGLEPRKPDWAGGLHASWTPGEDGAQARLADFLDDGLAGYRTERDRPDRPGTSQLSPHLRFGEIGPRQIWHAVQMALETGETGGSPADAEKFRSELGWREFS